MGRGLAIRLSKNLLVKETTKTSTGVGVVVYKSRLTTTSKAKTFLILLYILNNMFMAFNKNFFFTKVQLVRREMRGKKIVRL